MTKPAEPWLVRAEDDLRFAKLGLDHEYYSQVCFLAQQAAEKSLKALLIARKGAYPRLHNLVGLIGQCLSSVPEISKFEPDARILDQYYIPSRYPDGVPGMLPDRLPSEKHAQEALDIARSIFEFCLSFVSEQKGES